MPRTARELVDNGVYHVMVRGHNRAKLFESREDYRRFLSTVSRYKKEFPFDLYHYCLMPNHVHLLIKIIAGGALPKLMSRVLISYSHYLRKTYDRIGYIFQGRYKSLRVENEPYLLDCGRYIEKNPVRAEMVRDAADYEWSSFNFYAYNTPNRLLTPSPLYVELAASTQKRQKLYSEYIKTTRNYEILIDKALGLNLEKR